MNILFIPTTFGLSKPVNGGQTRLFNITCSLKKRGHKIIILEPLAYKDAQDRDIANVYYYEEYKLFNRGIFTFFRDLDPGFIVQLLKIIKTEEIDIIDVSYPVGGILIAKLLNMLMGNDVPIVYGSHNFEADFIKETFANNLTYSKIERILVPKYISLLEKFVCKNIANYIISVSKSDAEKFINQYNLSNGKVRIIPSGSNIIDISSYRNQKNRTKNRLGLDNYEIIIFFHGSYSHLPNKDAIESIKNFIAPEFEDNDDIIFLIGGNGVPEFRNSNIKSIGFIKDLNEIFSIADIAIVPLRYGAGTKLKFLDYLAAGLPIVTTKKGSEGIDVTNYQHAIVTENLNNEFIKAIKYLIENKDKRQQLGLNAHNLAKEKYDWNRICEKLDNFYMEISE